MNREKILFVISNFNIGGPQKSLLALLYEINYQKYDVSLLVLNENGSLIEFLPKEVKLIKPHPLHVHSLIGKEKLYKSFRLIKPSTIKFLFKLPLAFLHAYKTKSMAQARQHH